MNQGRRFSRIVPGLLFALSITLASTGVAVAADYPTRPVRLVVPFPPGGTLDILARGLTPNLTAQLGQQLVVENRPGANGVIGYELVAKAPADGYTMLIGGGSGIAVHPALLSKLPYHPVKDFAPVAMLATYPSVLIANPSFPPGSVKEVIAAARASPGKLTYGSPGTGNINHLVGESFRSIVGVDMVHAPYKGAALVINDVVAGHIPIGFVLLPGALPQIRAGKLKALAVTAEQRVSAAPNVPTMAEAGAPGLDLSDWGGILVPAGTPGEVIARLNQEVSKAVNTPEVRQRWVEQGLEPKTATPAELSSLIKSDVDKWNRIIKQAGVRAE
jgi:tripartite-type tricarboxylate transporter receptor subunit TctC